MLQIPFLKALEARPESLPPRCARRRPL